MIMVHFCWHEATTGNVFMAAQKFELSTSVLAVMPGRDTSRSNFKTIMTHGLHQFASIWLFQQKCLAEVRHNIVLLHTLDSTSQSTVLVSLQPPHACLAAW